MNKNKSIKYSFLLIILIVTAYILANTIPPVSNSKPTIVYHVGEHITVDADLITTPNVTDVHQQILTANAGKYPKVLLFPTYEGTWEDEFAWLSNNFGGPNGIPIMLEVFFPADPIFQLNTTQILATMNICNVDCLRFAEVYSRCQDFNLTFPTDYVSEILNFCRNHNLKLFWTEWKPEAFQAMKTYISGFEDIVTVSFSTNSGEWEPAEGFSYLRSSFLHWGGSVQSWYHETQIRKQTGSSVINKSESRNMPISLLIEHALLCLNMGAEVIQFEPYWYFFGDTDGKARESLWLMHDALNSKGI
jgi:hypothetical protein